MPCRLLLVAVLVLWSSGAQATDWPTAAHDAARSGRTADRVAPPYRVRWAKAWQYENIATVAQLIVADGRGYLGTLGRDGSLAGKVHCVDVRDGRDLWTYAELQGGIAHTLTWSPHAGGTVYAATTAGEVIALEAATGKQQWKFTTPLGGFVVNPCVVDGAVLLGSRQGVFYALNETDGALRWQRDVKFPICHTAAAADGVAYFLDEGIHPHALQIANGKPAEHWIPRQLAGGSARFYWPVITKDHVLLTVAPPHQYNWGVTDAVLFQVPGVKSRKGSDYFAIGTTAQEAAEQENVIQFLKEQSSNRVMHCLARTNGRPSCTPGVLYTGGSGSECTPPVLDQEGRPLVEYRSWYSLWDSDSWVNPYSALGTLDPTTGVVTQLRPQLEGKRVPWGHVWIIADESSAFTMAGDQLLVAHQGNFGGLDLTTSRTFAGIGKRDTWGGYPALSWSRQEWHGGPRSALTVVDDSIYYVVGGRVIACEGNAKTAAAPVKPVIVSAVETVSLPTFEAPVREPTKDDVRKVFAEYSKRQRIVDTESTSALRAALESHVANVMEYNEYAPFQEWRGIAPTTASQDGHAELTYALLIAHPHLEKQHQEKLTQYLRNRAEVYGVITDRSIRPGESRNYHRLDVNETKQALPRVPPRAREDYLTLGTFLELMEKDDDTRFNLGMKLGFSDDRNLSQPIVLDATAEPVIQFNRYSAHSKALTNIAGRIRLIARNGTERDVQAVVDDFMDALKPYLAHYRQVGRDCAQHIDAVPGAEGHPSAGGQYRNLGGPYVGKTHMAAIVYWTDLCPELGRILREFAPEETAAIKAWMLRNAQGFYLARWDTPVQEGEVPCPLYLTTQNYFHFFSSVADADFATHKVLVDMPACHADVYYIERLVHAIEASGRK